MDEKGATQVFEIKPGDRIEPEHDPSLPRYLILLRGGTPGVMVPLAPGTLWLGRSEESGLALAEPSVSRRHASVRLDPSGLAWLTDQESTNGTFRNGHRLPAMEPVRVHDGDRIGLGNKVVVKFACPNAEEEAFQKAMFERTVRDPMTGLYNRSYFLDQMRVLALRAFGRGLGLAVIMLDIDRFKAINDALGHDGGDAVLREVAGFIRQSARAEDLLARYGGEEFALALPIASADQACERAEVIRAALADRRWRFGNHRLNVTVSLGVAYASARKRQEIDALITSADRALYVAKNTGRNRVVRGLEAELDTPRTQSVDDI